MDYDFQHKLEGKSKKIKDRYRFLCQAVIGLAQKNRGIERDLSDLNGEGVWAADHVRDIKDRAGDAARSKRSRANSNISNYQMAFEELRRLRDIVEYNLPEDHFYSNIPLQDMQADHPARKQLH